LKSGKKNIKHTKLKRGKNMASYKEWNEHFDKVPEAKKNQLIKHIDGLLKDSMVKREYGSDLNTMAILLQNSMNRVKRG
jgi:hypothetical protein